jgi:hypothetical protein
MMMQGGTAYILQGLTGFKADPYIFPFITYLKAAIAQMLFTPLSAGNGAPVCCTNTKSRN